MLGPAHSQPISVPRAPRWRNLGWLPALLAALVFLAWDTAQNVRHYTRISSTYGVAVRAPALDPASPTGFVESRRHLIYPGQSLDGTHWIMQTQQMFARGEWRVHRVDEDNAPYGRPVHWGSPYRWWLGGCALVDHALTSQPLGLAVERAALYANPALFALLLLGLVPWIARRFGSLAAGFLALALVGSLPLLVLFAADNPDHHGLIQLCAMGCGFALFAGGGGWTQAKSDAPTSAAPWLPSPTQAQRAFTLSAIAGGVGLWVSAITIIPVFIGIGLGALASAWSGRQAQAIAQFNPTLWRHWGVIGCVTSLAAYVVENFPDNLGWRLEVNHPVYAFAWLGAGEMLTHLTASLHRGRLILDRTTWHRIGAGLGLLLLPLLVITLGGLKVFSAADAFHLALMHDYVPEFQGLAHALALAGPNFSTLAQSLPMLALLLTAAWLVHGSTPALARAVSAIPFSITTLIWLLSLKEFRWWNVGFGFLLIVIIAVITVSQATRSNGWIRPVSWVLIIFLFAPGLAESIRHTYQRNTVSADDILGLVERDLAHTLRQRTGAGPLVVLGGPATTSRLMYFGSAQGLGTAYWENLAGLKRAGAIFAARSAEEARDLVRAAGVTHIVLLSWDNFVEPYVRLSRGLSPQTLLDDYAFGLELTRAPETPLWLRRLPDHLPSHPALRGQRILLYEVTNQTRPEHGLVRRVNQLLDHEQNAAASAFTRELARHPDNLAVQIALARLQGVLNDSAGYAATMEHIEPLLPQATELEPDSRVDLVTLYVLSGLNDDARTQLSSALRTFDARALRHLSPGALINLLALTTQLDVVWPDPLLHKLAAQLVPPDGRP